MDPRVPQRRRTRRWIVLPVALALAAGAVYAEHRGASVSYAPVDARVEQADAAKLETRCTEADLVGCLEKEPTGASPESTPLGASGAVTVQQYAAAYYDTSAEDETIATQNLRNAGLQAIVHEKWTVPGSGRATADVVVMRFASAQGAQSRALAGAGDSLSATQSDGLELATPGMPGHVYPDRAADAQGYLNAQYFTAVGNLLMIVHFASVASFDQADFGSWALGEYLTLRTARIPAAPAATQDPARGRIAGARGDLRHQRLEVRRLGAGIRRGRLHDHCGLGGQIPRQRLRIRG